MYKAKMPEAWARIKWCEAQFGGNPTFGQVYFNGARWWRDTGYVHFRYEQDYLFYLLKWA